MTPTLNTAPTLTPDATGTTETFVVTAVPRFGAGAGTPGAPYELGVTVAPRPRPGVDGAPLTAANFPVFGNWPSVRASFAVTVDGASAVAATSSATVDGEAFAALLGALPVHARDHAADAQTALATVSGAQSLSCVPIWLETLNATQHLGGPGAGTLATPYSTALVGELRRVVTSPSRPDEIPLSISLGNAHPPDADRPVTDLHDRLAQLADFPDAMRRLGLIDTLTFPWPDVALGDTFTLQVFMSVGTQGGRTSAVCVGPVVTVHTRPSPTDGFEAPDVFDVVAVDTTHAAGQLARWSATGALPALRTPGLAWARVAGQQAHLAHRVGVRVQVEQQLARGLAPAVATDDLVIGHRVDVADVADGVWRSLCARTYAVTRLAITGTRTVLRLSPTKARSAPP